MTIASHIDQLRSKHEALEEKIRAEQRSPSADPLAIGSLKKRKLHIKEEIKRLGDQHV